MPGRPLPAELTDSMGELCSATNMLRVAEHDTSRARQRACTALSALATQEWYCYEVGELARLVRPDSSLVHTVSRCSGRLAVGRVVHVPPSTHPHYIAALKLDIPDPRPRHGPPFLEDPRDTVVHIALPPTVFAGNRRPYTEHTNGTLSIIDHETAAMLVDKDHRVFDPDELESIWKGLEYRGISGEDYAPSAASAFSTM